MSGNLIKKQILPILTFILFLFIWQCVIWIGDYKPILLPGPILVAQSIWHFIITGKYLPIWASVYFDFYWI